MRMMKMTGALMLAGMMAFATAANAQSAGSNSNSTNDNTSNSNASLSSTQQAQSTNAGVNAVVNQYGQKYTHAVVDQQVPLSLGGYGSFSQSNCSNALGVGASTKIFSFVASAPKPEINCQHIVRSDAFGREAGLAIASRKPMQAEIQRALSVWEACTASEETTAACIRMRVIRYVDPSKPDLKQTMPWPHFEDEAIIMPAAGEAAGMQAPAPVVSHDKDASAMPATQPYSNRTVSEAQQAVNVLPWVQKYAAAPTGR